MNPNSRGKKYLHMFSDIVVAFSMLLFAWLTVAALCGLFISTVKAFVRAFS